MLRFLQKTYFVTYKGNNGTEGSLTAIALKGKQPRQIYSEVVEHIREDNPEEEFVITDFKRIK